MNLSCFKMRRYTQILKKIQSAYADGVRKNKFPKPKRRLKLILLPPPAEQHYVIAVAVEKPKLCGTYPHANDPVKQRRNTSICL